MYTLSGLGFRRRIVYYLVLLLLDMVGDRLVLTNKVCAAVLLLWVTEAMFNRILFCCNGHQGTVLRFVEIVTKPPVSNAGKQYLCTIVIR
jgi:hypothetical protein